MEKNNRSKPLTRALKVIQTKNGLMDNEDTPQEPGSLKCRSVRKLKDAKRFLSQVIAAYQRGELTTEKAKTLTYLCTSFVNVCREVEVEDKVNRLEQKLGSLEDGAI